MLSSNVPDSEPSTPKADTSPSDRRKPLLVLAFQTDQRANGGLESLTLVLGALRRFVPTILTQRESRITERWRRAGFSVELVEMPPPARSWNTRERAAALAKRLPTMGRGQIEVMRAVARLGARVVHFNDSDAVSFGALGARLSGARVVVALRGTTGIHRWRWFLVAHLADVVVTLTEDMRHRYEQALAQRRFARRPRARILTIPSIVVTQPSQESREDIRHRLGIPEAAFAVGMVGALVPLKRTADVIRVLGRALEMAGDEARLYVIGDHDATHNPYAGRCAEERARLPDPSRVRFTGHVDSMGDWYRALDLVVVASDDEGLARAMIEALAHGTPVVSTDVCSAREVLEQGGAGRVVPVGDFDALAREVLALAADDVGRRKLGEAGAALVRERYSAEAVGEAYDSLYEELAARAFRTRSTTST